MTLQELKQYVKDKRKAKANEWRAQNAIHGRCEPLTDKEYYKYREIIFNGKNAYKTKIVNNNGFKL
jgi:ethanolamine utilization protein EutP (predicted NTPase)